jgi:hypothetical protein
MNSPAPPDASTRPLSPAWSLASARQPRSRGPMLASWFRRRYAASAPTTWSRELATLRATVRCWHRCGWLAVDPTDGLERRRERVDRARALTRRQLERLFVCRDFPLRERTLWRLLYEPPPAPTSCWPWTWRTWIWATGGRGYTARVARSSGCSGRPGQPSCSPACWPAEPADRSSWVAVRTGWTLHQLRHSALTHAAEDGTNLPLLLAQSRHASVRSLERATPAQDPRQSPATSPRPTRHAGDRDPPALHLDAGRCVRR